MAELRGQMVRAELELSSDTLGKKIRNATTEKVPNVLVIGEREVEENTVTLRRYGSREQRTFGAEAFRAMVGQAIAERSDAVFALDSDPA